METNEITKNVEANHGMIETIEKKIATVQERYKVLTKNLQDLELEKINFLKEIHTITGSFSAFNEIIDLFKSKND